MGELHHIENIADWFAKSNSDHEVSRIRETPWFGGKFSQAIEAFPTDNFFQGMRKDGFNNLRLTKLDWYVGTYIETLRFTMSDGTVSPKFGGKSFNATCEFDTPVKRITATYRERGLVSLTF